jgi:hypothetical protein
MHLKNDSEINSIPIVVNDILQTAINKITF